ncbi:MAG: nickel insertion protein [Verrucomicrobiota bacterium]
MLPQGYETDSVLQLETNIDDLSPEWVGFAVERLRENGALDVWITPIQMKKGRPGILLSLLCEKEKLDLLSHIIFTETGAFGLRLTEVIRLKLHRDFIEVETEFGFVTVKRGFRGEELVQVAPEYEICRIRALSAGVPFQRVYDAAKQAATAAQAV